MITIRSGIRDYDVNFEKTTGFLSELDRTPQRLYAIDENVWRLYRGTLFREVDPCDVFLLVADEDRKTMDTVFELYDHLITRPSKRNTTLISVGGGIVQDVTGFACSTLYRGINWIYIPTTLLAQADSCIGSKTSLNYHDRKNLIGSFYPPSHIHVYTPFLETLEDDYFFSGLGEVVKLAIIGGEKSMTEMVGLLPDASRRSPDSLFKCVERSLLIKHRYISEDEFDTGKRNMLNFGHCFGHALESATHFSMPHGQAVVVGIILANIVAKQRGILSDRLFNFMADSLLMPCLTTKPKRSDLNVGHIVSAMEMDKKRTGNDLALIMVDDRYEMSKVTDLKPDEVRDAIEQYVRMYPADD
jgi:3-dehydroquinate synthase